MKSRTIISLSAIFGLAAGASPAAGTIITIAFSGEITFVEDGLVLSGPISVGTAFEGIYSYDSNRPDNSPNDPTGGGYSFPDYNMAFSIGELTFTTPDLAISILNHSVLDSYDVSNATPFSAHGVDWAAARITLRDETTTAFSSDALPVDAPDLADFGFQRAFLLRQVDHRESSIKGTITSMTLIPEPSTFLLLSGILLLGCGNAQTARTRPVHT